MKKDGQGFSVTVWSVVALGAVGIGVVAALLAGYFLGHFTGHEKTVTVSAVTVQAEAGGEGGEAGEEEATEAGEEEATGEGKEGAEEKRSEEASPEEGSPEEKGAEEKGAEEGSTEAGGGGAAAAGAGDPAAGQEVFASNCSICHGTDGHGGGGGPDLRTMPKAKTEAGAIEQVTNGGGGMPAFKGVLSEEEIKNVAAYVVQEIVGSG